MKKRSIIAVAAASVVIGITGAVAGGMWQTLPIVAAQAYCAVLSTGITGTGAPFNPTPTGATICQVQIPAGPPALTGNEIVPADTYPASSPYLTVPQGFAPATAGVPIILLDSGAYTYSVPNATRANFTLANPTNWLILDGSGAMAQVNVQLPGTQLQPALNGQQIHIVSSQVVTLLGIVGQTTSAGAAAVTVDNAPTQLLVGATSASAVAISFIYDAPISTWFRTQ